ncbi:4-hydroxythreonine-4-phosphate dehydrogenase PdxA [Thiohalorhabdus sp.]|uniref:4-hydroxythreonine-4-phosphate dehydrogenase PdxA n=1 Tax=Thiohalorhabdus sp. TaxID=3094134 RepID=UPI002FC28CF6
MSLPLAVTPGEPAGIGPDLVLTAADDLPCGRLVVFGDPDQLERRTRELGRRIPMREWQPGQALPDAALPICPVPHAELVAPGRPEPANAPSLLRALDRASNAVRQGHCGALVTGPLNKEIITRGSATPFTGHTEYLAQRAGATSPVMMLVGGDLRVALVTTHLPLREVPDAVTAERVERCVGITVAALRRDFAIDRPRLLVTGLNPHAGEGGQLGQEETRVIAPALERLRHELAETATVVGPLAADTAFTPAQTASCHAIVAMYHDQGLTPLKQRAFGTAVNVTLGLPFVRTSVDHGTAFDLAGTGYADPGSFRQALVLARELATNRTRAWAESG